MSEPPPDAPTGSQTVLKEHPPQSPEFDLDLGLQKSAKGRSLRWAFFAQAAAVVVFVFFFFYMLEALSYGDSSSLMVLFLGTGLSLGGVLWASLQLWKAFKAIPAGRIANLDFDSFYFNSVAKDEIELIGLRQISRLIDEQKRHRLYAVTNLGIGLLLVFVTLFLITSLFSSISIEGLGDSNRRINLIRDCENAYSVSMVRSNGDFRTPSEVEQIRRVMELRAGTISRKNECLKTILPTQTVIDRLAAPPRQNNQEVSFWNRVSAEDLYSMLSRLLLVILAQTLTYFFLKLYVGNLSDARYFSNEITNFESRILAYQVATKSGDTAAQVDISKLLARTDRNLPLANNRRPLFGSDSPVLKDIAETLRELRSSLTPLR